MLGSYAWGFDHLISTLPEITSDSRVKQWFFIRYADEDGLHVRLRIGIAGADAKAFDRDVYPKLHSLVMQLSSLPVEETPKFVRSSGAEFDLSRFSYGVKRDQYKPETEIYGGLAGVAIAERLFQESSKIAIDLISAERNGLISRKDVVPALMCAALEEFEIEKPVCDFLSFFISYWIRSVPSGEDYITAFEGKFRELTESGIPITREDEDYGPLIAAALKNWRESLRGTQESYRKIGEYNAELEERLLFYFIHLMNNRLGFRVLDEIYLAVLLKGWLEKTENVNA